MKTMRQPVKRLGTARCQCEMNVRRIVAPASVEDEAEDDERAVEEVGVPIDEATPAEHTKT